MSDNGHLASLSPFPPGYRASGVLLHVTSLPSPYGIGDVGPAALAWVDRLHEADQELVAGAAAGAHRICQFALSIPVIFPIAAGLDENLQSINPSPTNTVFPNELPR